MLWIPLPTPSPTVVSSPHPTWESCPFPGPGCPGLAALLSVFSVPRRTHPMQGMEAHGNFLLIVCLQEQLEKGVRMTDHRLTD